MKSLTLFCLLCLSAVLTGCGQTGPLYLPSGDQPSTDKFMVKG